jgi:ribonuclease BN (tRNA processing enzyme)
MEVLFAGSSTVQRRFAVNVVEHVDRVPHHQERLDVVPFEVRHASGAPAYALRVTDNATGAILAYSGDTEWTDASSEAPAAYLAGFLILGSSAGVPYWHQPTQSPSAS